MANIVEKRWLKSCNGPGDPLQSPAKEIGQPGRNITVSITDEPKVIVDCNNFQQGKCAISKNGSIDCYFLGLLNETRRRREFLYRSILLNPGISRKQLAEKLGAQQGVVSVDVEKLRKDGIVVEGESRPSPIGRSQTALYIKGGEENRLQ